MNMEINIEVPIVMPPNMYTCSGARRYPAGISPQPPAPVLRTEKGYGLICCLYIVDKMCPKTLKNAPRINKMSQELCLVFHNSLPHLSWELESYLLDWFVLNILLIRRAPKLEKCPKINKMPQKIRLVFHNSLPHLSWKLKKLSSEFVCCEWG